MVCFVILDIVKTTDAKPKHAITQCLGEKADGARATDAAQVSISFMFRSGRPAVDCSSSSLSSFSTSDPSFWYTARHKPVAVQRTAD